MTPDNNRASFLAATKAVLWSFLGIRRRKEYEEDVRLSPVHVIVAGLIGGALFVIGVIVLVKLILANQGAAT